MKRAITRPINEIILHCTATFESQKVTMADIKRWHVVEHGWGDIGYHFVVDKDGAIYQGRALGQQGAHCKGHNATSIGVCYIGGLEDGSGKPKDTRTPKQKEAMFALVRSLLDDFGLRIENVHCHNEFANKACPCFSREDFAREYWRWLLR